MDNITTQVKITKVEPDNQQKCKIDAEIPAFDSSYDIRFITWWTSQGKPPKVGEVGLAELKATSRQQYFIKKGVLEAGDPDGSEKLYQLYWDMLSFAPNAPSNEQTEGNTSVASPRTPSGPSGKVNGGVYLDANERYRIDNLMKNARDAMWMVINHGASDHSGPNLYADMDSVVKESLVIRNSLNEVLDARLGKPLGLIPAISNSEELAEFTKNKKWKKAQIIQALNDKDYKDSQEYLAVDGHTVMGLAQLLVEALDG